jgi:four helix bundle protein
MAKFLHTRSPIGVALCAQLLKSGTSAGANYEEADDGSSPRDVRAKRQIVLRELKETSFRLRVLRKTGILTPAHDPVIAECAELVKIVATLIRRSNPT